MTQPTEPGDESTQFTPSSYSEASSTTPQWPSQSGASQPDPGYVMPPPAPTYGPIPQTSNSAVAALVLSIVSWVICPIIPAIIALVFANKAEKEIASGNGWVTGGGLVTAAKIVAWINIGVYSAVIALGVLVFILAVVGGVFTSM